MALEKGEEMKKMKWLYIILIVITPFLFGGKTVKWEDVPTDLKRTLGLFSVALGRNDEQAAEELFAEEDKKENLEYWRSLTPEFKKTLGQILIYNLDHHKAKVDLRGITPGMYDLKTLYSSMVITIEIAPDMKGTMVFIVEDGKWKLKKW